MTRTRWSSRAAAVLPALLLAELLLVAPVAPATAAATTTSPSQVDPVSGKAVPPGTAVEVDAAPIDLSGAASADAAGVEVLADGGRERRLALARPDDDGAYARSSRMGSADRVAVGDPASHRRP